MDKYRKVQAQIDYLPAITRTSTGKIDLAARISFAITLALTPFRLRFQILSRPVASVFGDYTDFLLFAADIAMLATLVLWAVSLRLRPRQIGFGVAAIWLPLAGLTLAGSLSILGSEDQALSLYHAVRLTLLFLFFLFIINEIHSPGWVIVPVAIQIGIQAAVAIAQSLLQHSIGLEWLGEYTLDPAWQGVSIVWQSGVRSLRAYGLSDHPNILGGCLAFGLLLVLSAYIHPGPRRHTWTALVIPPGLLALLLTFSRSAWLSFATGMMLLVAVQFVLRRWQAVKDLGWLKLASGLLLVPFIVANIASLGARLNIGRSFVTIPAEEQALGERSLLNASINSIFTERPLTGTGLGTATVAIQKRFPDFPVDYQPPHFTPLAVAVETGLLGAVFYLLLGTLPWLILLGNRRLLLENHALLAASTLLLASTVVGFFDYYTWLLVPGRLWQWLIWGLWAAAYARRKS